MKSTGLRTGRQLSKTGAVRPVPYYLGHILIYVGLVLIVSVLAWLTFKAVTIYGAYGQATTHLATLETLLDPAQSLDDSALDLPKIIQEAEGAAASLDKLYHESRPFWPLLSGLAWLPGYGPTLEALPTTLATAQELSHGGRLLLDSLAPVFVDDSPGGALLPHLGGQLTARQDELAQMQQRLEQRQIQLAQLELATLTSGLGRRVNQLNRSLPLAIAGLGLAQELPALLGFEGPRRYLVITQNADEIRPAGGYINAAGHLALDQGQITEFVMQDSYAVDQLSEAYPYPPEPLYRYMAAEYWVLRDASWSPDFPTAAQTAIELYQLGQGVSTEGVIALDQHALPYLLQATGPLAVDGERVTAANVVMLMRKHWTPAPGQAQDQEWWRGRKSFMLSLAETMRHKFEQEQESIDLPRLLEGVRQALREKHLLLYFQDESTAQFLARQNWNGALRPTEGDYLMLVDANVGFNKASALIERQLQYRLTLIPDGGGQAQARLLYHHAAPETGQPCAIDLRYDPVYAQNMERCYWNYHSLIVPEAAQLRQGPQFVVPAAYLLRPQPSSGQIEVSQPGPAKRAWSQLFLLPPQKTLALDYHYTLPAGTVRQLGDEWRYTLYLQKQPGVQAPTAEVGVTLPPGAHLLASRPAPDEQEGLTLTYRFELNTDQPLEIIYDLPEGG